MGEVHADYEKEARVSRVPSNLRSKRNARTDVDSSLAKLLDHVDAVGLGSWERESTAARVSWSSMIRRDRGAVSSPMVAMIEVCKAMLDQLPSRLHRVFSSACPPRDVEKTHLAQELGVERVLNLGRDGEGGEPFELGGDLDRRDGELVGGELRSERGSEGDKERASALALQLEPEEASLRRRC